MYWSICLRHSLDTSGNTLTFAARLPFSLLSRNSLAVICLPLLTITSSCEVRALDTAVTIRKSHLT